MTTRTCLNCGKPFGVRGKRSEIAKYCSMACRIAYTKIEKTCSQCGKAFITYPARKDSQFCSKACARTFSKEQSGSMRICPICGKEFYAKGNPATRGVYCSKTCSALRRKNGKIIKCDQCGKEVYKQNIFLQKYAHWFCSLDCANKHQGKDRIKFVCIICKKDFTWSPSRTSQANPTYCSMVCRNKDKDRLLENSLKGNYAQAHKNGLNKLELAGKAILDAIGVEYQEQAPMFKKFLVDVLIENSKLVIQWDGDYWHCHPLFEPFSERQLRRKKLDISQDAYLSKAGYKVLRFWESDVKKKPEWVKRSIIQSL
jgi:very-short-patch-repair endonuclease